MLRAFAVPLTQLHRVMFIATLVYFGMLHALNQAKIPDTTKGGFAIWVRAFCRLLAIPVHLLQMNIVVNSFAWP